MILSHYNFVHLCINAFKHEIKNELSEITANSVIKHIDWFQNCFLSQMIGEMNKDLTDIEQRFKERLETEIKERLVKE